MAPPPIPAIASSSHLATAFVGSFYLGREVECSTGTVFIRGSVPRCCFRDDLSICPRIGRSD
ncbi:unnamed protein product [Musa banksii]